MKFALLMCLNKIVILFYKCTKDILRVKTTRFNIFLRNANFIFKMTTVEVRQDICNNRTRN